MLQSHIDVFEAPSHDEEGFLIKEIARQRPVFCKGPSGGPVQDRWEKKRLVIDCTRSQNNSTGNEANNRTKQQKKEQEKKSKTKEIKDKTH